jgi:ribosomal protein L32
MRTCPTCLKPIERKRFPSGLEARGRFESRIYCDRECMAAGMMQDAPGLAAQRVRAAKLRGTVCEECGATERLHAHHRDEDPTNNVPENIATLCGSCHLRWHWRHGKKAKPRAVCTACGEPARRHGLCGKHHQRWKKYGDPLLTRRKIGTEWVIVRDE